MDRVGVGGERVEMFNLASSEGPLFARIAAEFVAKIVELGPNPIKRGRQQAA